MPEYLKRKIKEYLLTLDHTEKDEWYMTERNLNDSVLENFYKWLILEPDFCTQK